jgi:hypothetical protein
VQTAQLLSTLGVSLGKLVSAKPMDPMGSILQPKGDSSLENHHDYGITLAQDKA